MNLAGPDDLVQMYIGAVMLSEIGEHALIQFADSTLTLRAATTPTLFSAADLALDINVEALRRLTPEEQCAVLCHETFHFFHFVHDSVGYRMRNTLPSAQFGNQEEELTINGTTSDGRATPRAGLNYRLFSENAVLRDRGLAARTSHGGASDTPVASRAEQAAFTLTFSSTDFGAPRSVRSGPPQRLLNRPAKVKGDPKVKGERKGK